MRAPKYITQLAFAALLVVLAATLAALSASDTPNRNEATSPEATTRHSQPVPEKPLGPARRLAVETARRYALAARNWTPATYDEASERQIRLAGGAYRRALIARRPGQRELDALRSDGAQSRAVVLKVELERRVRLPAARVLVVLDELTEAGGQTIAGKTLNAVRLRRYRIGWRVVGWTVVPGR